MALQVISQHSSSLLLERYAGKLIFLQRLLDDSHTLLVCLGGGVPLERAQLFRSKARNPHVPVPLKDNLDLELAKLPVTNVLHT